MDYPFGRLIISILKLIGWVALGMGILIAFGGAGGSLYFTLRQEFGIGLPTSFFSSLAGISIALLSMVALAFLDHISATIDTAVWTKRSVRISEKQLAISKELLRISERTLEVHMPPVLPGDSEEAGDGRKRGLLGILSRRKKPTAGSEDVERREPAFTAVETQEQDDTKPLTGTRAAPAISSGNGTGALSLEGASEGERVSLPEPVTNKT